MDSIVFKQIIGSLIHLSNIRQTFFVGLIDGARKNHMIVVTPPKHENYVRHAFAQSE